MGKQYWLMKSEPDQFSIDDLAASPGQTTAWEGIRNYQARNFMRDQMKRGDGVLFYHSSCPLPGVAGIAEVVGEAHPDPSCWDPRSEYYDPRSSPENPRWFQVCVKLVERFPEAVSLKRIREDPELQEMLLLKKGQRLSIQPVTRHAFTHIRQLGRKG